MFRLVLARVASLCQQQTTTLLSPYEGAGVITSGGTPVDVFHVTYTNTPDIQRLEGLTQSLTTPSPPSE